MPDVFDEIEVEAPAGDIFDEVALLTPEQTQAANNATMGAMQLIDLMRAPLAFDWSDVADKAHYERFVKAQELQFRADALEKAEAATAGSDVEAFQRRLFASAEGAPPPEFATLRREADRILAEIPPESRVGQAIQAEKDAYLERVKTPPAPPETRTPMEAVQGFLGPGLSSQLTAPISAAARSAIPAAAGAVGAAAYTFPPARLATILSTLAPLAGGFAASQLAGAGQEMVLQSTETPEETQRRHQSIAAEREQFPVGSRLGEAVPSAMMFSPSITELRKAFTGDTTAQRNIMAAAGIGGSVAKLAGASNAEAIQAGVENIILNRPTRLGQAMGLYPASAGGEVPVPKLPFEHPRILGTTVQLSNGELVPGSAWNSPHALILPNALNRDPSISTDYPGRLGFRVREPDGTVRFADRKEAAQIAKERGMIPEDAPNELTSEQLAQLPDPNTQPQRTALSDEERIAALMRAGMTREDAVAGLARIKQVSPETQTGAVPPPQSTGEPAARGGVERIERLPEGYRSEQGLPPEEAARRKGVVDEVMSDVFKPTELPAPRTLPSPEKPEAGGLFGAGGKRPATTATGRPPSGNREWLEVAPWYKRAGFEREGASKILQNRQQNSVGKTLGAASDRQFDVESELAGKMWQKMDRAMSGMNRKQADAALTELETYVREVENGRTAPALSPEATRILEGWKDIAEFTGLLAQSHGVQVADKGGYRPMRLIGREYVPRMFHPEFLRTIRDPKKYATAWNRYVDELATAKGIPQDEAAAYLNELAGGGAKLASNDFFGNIEMARQERLPESFYDYDLRRVMSSYINRYAQRMGQIVAYGQRIPGPRGPAQKNLWDIARDEVRGGDKVTHRWLNEAEAQATRERPLTGAGLAMGRLQTLATGLLLSNPTTTVPRNLIGGLMSTAEQFGYTRELKTMLGPMMKATKRMEAKAIGAVREDMAAMLHADQLGDSPADNAIRGFTDLALKVSGYNASENFVRTHNMLAASQFARDAATAISGVPASKKAKEMAAFITRMGVSPDALAKEGGEWKTGEQTRKFIRASIAQQQGGYQFNQVPLWAGSPAGRFFYQFGRWGTQRVQNLWENGVKPALVGTPTTVNGVPMTVHDFKPMLRMGVSLVALGEIYAGIAKLFFDRDRKDATLTEIGAALKEDQVRAAKLIGGRIINDIIMGGTLGIWGQPVDWAVAAKDQSRLKNPAQPPGGAGVRAILEFTQRALDQQAVTPDDVKELARQAVPGATGLVDSFRNAIDEAKYEAENDVRTLRNAGRRFAEEKGLDVPPAAAKEAFRGSPRTPVFSAIRDALLVGDVARARELRADYLRTIHGSKRKEAERNLNLSVKARQPFRVGPFTNEELRRDFYQWAAKRLPADDLNQVRRVQARYIQAAKQAGLWSKD